MASQMAITSATGDVNTNQVTLSGRGDPNRAFRVCVSGTGVNCADGTTESDGSFKITFESPGPNPRHGYHFTVRHLEADGGVGNNAGWSAAVNNPIEEE